VFGLLWNEYNIIIDRTYTIHNTQREKMFDRKKRRRKNNFDIYIFWNFDGF